MVSGSQKVARAHLERLAIVYLRQSSPRQVRENVRSTERQYGLAEKAVQLGWEPARVLTVDGDLGISGRGTHAREAYKELVGRVCLGEVGAIFGLEVARLARTNAELLRLLEFCAVTDTIVVDTDGIYDLKDFNDRTILGLKAQWSEAELHIMAGIKILRLGRAAAHATGSTCACSAARAMPGHGFSMRLAARVTPSPPQGPGYPLSSAHRTGMKRTGGLVPGGCGRA